MNRWAVLIRGVEGVLEAVAEALESVGRGSRDAALGLDVQDDVDIVCRAHDPDADMYCVKLSHQAADERPGPRGESGGEFGDGGSRVWPRPCWRVDGDRFASGHP